MTKKPIFIAGTLLTLLLIFLYVFYFALTPKTMEKTNVDTSNLSVATFAGGCFWCVESAFEHYNGVYKVTSGYEGGEKENPTYKEVSAGKTKYIESVKVYFEPSEITYNDLLEIFWRQIDPTDDGGSFVDRGKQYKSVIFYHNEEQKILAEVSKKELGETGNYDKPIVTEIRSAGNFYPAEDYHQDYYKKNPIRYKYYRGGSGRDDYREEQWGEDKDYKVSGDYEKPGEEKLRSILTPLQYKVTQEEATEKPFDNEYWDNKKDGIYVDLLSGEPLFSSTHKYKSGTGWPSFTQPLEESNIVEKEDRKFFSVRTEIRSRDGENHIGHVFEDGPNPTGLRYCMNSAALKFIPEEELEESGYGEYLKLFEN